MSVSLKLYDDPTDALEASRRSRASSDLQVLLLDGRYYLKKPGSDGVEPKFLCTDGRWRRYDLVPELPGSEAAK